MAGLKAFGVVWLSTVGATALWQGMVTIYGEFLGLYGIAAVLASLATIVTSLGVLGVADRRTVRWCRRFGSAIGAIFQLDEKLDAHREESRQHWQDTQSRLDDGDERMTRMEASIDVLAKAERAAVRGALDAVTAPRPPRRTDPAPRDGWRE